MSSITPKTKHCYKCGEVKPASEFNRCKSNKDGLDSRCRKCQHAYHKEYYQRNKERIKKRTRKYQKEHEEQYRKRRREYYLENKDSMLAATKKWKQENREHRNAYMRQWRKDNPGKAYEYTKRSNKKYPKRHKARQILNDNVRSGNIPNISTQVCECCGAQAEHYHHHDYKKPLDVVPLCNSCHWEIHS